MNIKRRQFLLALGAVPAVSAGNTGEIGKHYEDPFEGYSNFIRRLGGYVGETVGLDVEGRSIRGHYIVMGGSPPCRLLSLSRETNKNPDLFPHRVEFDNGTAYNLESVFSITLGKEGDSERWTQDANEQRILYLNVPARNEFLGRLEKI
jgi:hypothetical protein